MNVLGSLLLTWIYLNPQTSTVQPLQFGNGWAIHPKNNLACDPFGIKVKPYISKGRPRTLILKPGYNNNMEVLANYLHWNDLY